MVAELFWQLLYDRSHPVRKFEENFYYILDLSCPDNLLTMIDENGNYVHTMKYLLIYACHAIPLLCFSLV
jgi:hypothetical protein